MTTSAQSQKNSMSSPAAQDLGLGDQLQQQLEDTMSARKKSILNIGGMSNPMDVTSSISPAVQALLSKAGGGA
jgi:hypothetical protein